MPYVSEAQRRFFHANKAKLEKQGVDVAEWDAATKGKPLPERKKQVVHNAASFEKASLKRKVK